MPWCRNCDTKLTRGSNYCDLCGIELSSNQIRRGLPPLAHIVIDLFVGGVLVLYFIFKRGLERGSISVEWAWITAGVLAVGLLMTVWVVRR